MRIVYGVLLGLICSVSTNAQFFDDFSDLNLTENPAWVFDTSSWDVSSTVLKSKNQVANSYFGISTQSSSLRNTEWTLILNLQFNTSSLNYVDVFLTADSSDLVTKNQNGYFVRVGGTKDEICLYKKQNGTSILLIDGLDGVTNKSSNTIALRIRCSETFNWNLERNLTGQPNNYTSEGSAIDSTFKKSNWFGLLVAQSTSSFFLKHSFDNISVSTILRDTLAPKLISSGIVTDITPINLVFDEELAPNWIDSVGAIELYNSSGSKIPIERIEKDMVLSNSYNLVLSDSTIFEGVYFIRMSNIQDLYGNKTRQYTQKVVYLKPSFAAHKEIVFSELMTDPVPSAGLPEIEYFEIFNNTGKSFDLKDYVLSDPSTSVKLPSFLLGPKEYLAICRSTDTSLLGPFAGKVLGLNSVPSLNNSGDVIKLESSKGVLVDAVSYKLSWFKDSNKDDGGYSLELIDPYNFCLEAENWKASNSATGGTPGKQNTVFAILKDTIAPFISSVNVLGSNKIQILFSENVDSSLFINSNILLEPAISVNSLTWKSDSLNQLVLMFENDLPKGVELKITLFTLQDCAENRSNNVSKVFVIPEIVSNGAVLINELLFNPVPYGADFVELYNPTDKIIDMKGWYLANLKNDTIANKKVIFKNTFLLYQKEYVVITEDKNNILNNYPKAVVDRIVEVSVLPTYYDDLGNVILLSPNSTVIDQFDYTEEMHSALLTKKEGVSLEKINPGFKTNDPNNWTSASKESGYATPGYANSQYVGLGISDDDISVEPQLITPNGDGDKDFMVFKIKSENISALRNIIIYDMLGREIKRPLKSAYSGAFTLVQWDGTDETNNPVSIGHYIVWFEALDKSGNVKHYKKKAVVGTKF